MLRGEFAAEELSPAELHEAYLARLRETVAELGVETVSNRAGVDRTVVRGLDDGEGPELTLEVAAAILGADPDLPDGETLAAEARDMLLMGMTRAVVDVDAVAAGIDIERDPKAIQQKVEGRHPMTLVEYAHLHSFVSE